LILGVRSTRGDAQIQKLGASIPREPDEDAQQNSGEGVVTALVPPDVRMGATTILGRSVPSSPAVLVPLRTAVFTTPSNSALSSSAALHEWTASLTAFLACSTLAVNT